MISVVISSYLIDDKKEEILRACVESLVGYDELIVLATKDNIGFCKAWNLAGSLAKGDYIVFIGDANIMTKGSLKDLAVGYTVTYPVGTSGPAFVFCMPREVYDNIGLYDMEYNEGIHFMDDDLFKRIKENKIPLKKVEGVEFSHPVGGRTVGAIENFTQKVQRNKDIFTRKWGKADGFDASK